MTDSADTPIPEPLAPETAEAAATPDPLAGIPALLADAIRRRGFEELSSVQRAVVAADSEGQDLRISSQTGSGKTVAIGLALAKHLCGSAGPTGARARRAGPSVLVLVPTRELAMQVRDELGWLFAGVRGLGIEVVMGGTSIGLERRALARGPRIVVGTPGRTLDHLKAGALVCDEVDHVVLDESDRMLDMGFREDLEAILEGLPKERRTHLVSATFPGPVRKLADRFQTTPLHIQGTRLGDANCDIEHIAHVVDRHDTYAAIVNLLLMNEGGRCLIFVERRVDASALAAKLSGDGFPVQAFSGELAQAQRTRTLNAFRSGSIKTLVSTDVAARGIDVPDIELVIHGDPPGDPDGYVHRSGRTGRAGRTGRSVLLVPPRAQRHVSRLLNVSRIKVEWKPAPSAGWVGKQLRKRFRRDIQARLGAEEAPTQQQIDYAKGILDGRDPAAVVALLLEIAQPKPAREPMQVSEPSAQPARGERHPRGPAGRDSRGHPGNDHRGSAGRNPRGPGTRRGASEFVRFTINWGEANGAAPNRVLGHVCRRGQIESQLVGAIEIGPDETHFQVEAGVATRFEQAVRRPDKRDPMLRIVRAGGSPGAGGRDGQAPRHTVPRAKRRFIAKRDKGGS